MTTSDWLQYFERLNSLAPRLDNCSTMKKVTIQARAIWPHESYVITLAAATALKLGLVRMMVERKVIYESPQKEKGDGKALCDN